MEDINVKDNRIVPDKPKKKSLDTRIRGINPDTWSLFKRHCALETVRRGKTISINTRLLEMIDMVVASDQKLKL